MQFIQLPRWLLVAALLVAILVLQGELFMLIRAPKTGRFLPIARNPYLLLDTATGTECLRVRSDRAGEMRNWILFSDRDDDVHDSYVAAAITYGALNKYFKDQEKRSSPDSANTSDQNDPILQEIARAATAGNKAEAEAQTAASDKTKTEFGELTRLLNSLDSIPVCSKQ